MAAPEVLVLCYHAVSDRWDAPLSVTPGELRRQLTTLLDRGWQPATFTEAVVRPARPKTLAVTFDDAFASVGTRAAPILAELGVPGTVFVPTDYPGTALTWPGTDHWAAAGFAGELQALSWDELRVLSAAGWEIGAHTCSHPRLPDLGGDTIAYELAQARAVCEREIPQPCRSVAYPFGAADRRVRAAARTAGYEAAAGLSAASFVLRDPYDWPRVGVWHAEPHWRFRVKVAPATSHLRGARGAEVLDGLRKRVKASR